MSLSQTRPNLCLSLLTAISFAQLPSTVSRRAVLNIVQMIVGNGSNDAAYNFMGPAYDVALKSVVEMYPNVFANHRVTRYFVPGEGYTCAQATGQVIEGLYTLLTDRDSEDEFRVVLSPGCGFEVMALGNFGREANVPVLASVASGSQLAPERYPTVVTLSAAPFTVVIQTVVEIMKRYGWRSFNLLCDRNGDSLQNAGTEIICDTYIPIIMKMNQNRALRITVLSFDSANPPSYKTVIAKSKLYSTINVMAAFANPQKLLLIEASLAGMSNGEYVFLSLPVSSSLQLEDLVQSIVQRPSEDLTPFFEILPFVFQLDFDDMNWTAVENMTKEMNDLSKRVHNWTVTAEHQHNIYRLAGFDSVQILGKVLNETYDQLSDMSAVTFASKFANRQFDISSRHVKTSSMRFRLCDATVKQYRRATRSFQAVLVFDNALLRLLIPPAQHSDNQIEWPSKTTQFPPDYRPTCLQSSGADCAKNTTGDPAVIPAVVICVILLVILTSVFVFRYSRRFRQEWSPDETWWMLEGRVTMGEPIDNTDRYRHYNRDSASHFGLGFHRLTS